MPPTTTLPDAAEPTRAPASARRRRALVIASDSVAIVAGLVLAIGLAGRLAPTGPVAAIYGLATWGWMAGIGLYHSRLATQRRVELGGLARSGVRAVVVLGLVAAVAGLTIDLRTGLILLVAVTSALAIERELLRTWFTARRKAGHGVWTSILVADAEDGERLRQAIDADRSSPHVIAGQVDPNECTDPDDLLTRTLTAARRVGAGGVVVAESSLAGRTANSLVRGLLEARVHVDLTSNLADISTDRLVSRSLGTNVAIRIAPRPRGGWRGRAKRLFDLVVTVSALAVLAPVLAAVAVAVKVSSPGPVFFRQERVGRYGELFQVLKFRSMVVDAERLKAGLEARNEGAGPLFKLRADPRVTPVGRFIRKTSLDELPQLLNVLRNEMSLVGPRPALRSEMAEWDPELYGRLQVKPGITGMWQVSGRSGTSFAEYTRLDLYYVHNWSLLVDLSILARTVPAVLRNDGAY